MAKAVRSALLPRVGLTAAASLLGIGLSLTGLHVRLFGSLPTVPAWFGPLDAIPRALGLAPAGLAWPILVVGLTWFGAVTGLWLRLPWGKSVTLLLSATSALALGAGTVLAAVAAVCVLLWKPNPGRPPSEP